MKRTLAIILSACMLLALISCDFSSLADETTSEAETTTAPTESTTADDDTTINANDTTSPIDENTTVKSETTAAPVTTSAPETTAPPVKEEITITEQVLLDYNGFKVTAKSFSEDGFWGPELKILVENNTTKNISLMGDELIINNYMINDLLACSVAPGKKVNETIDIRNSDLEKAGIESIGQIELYLRLYDKDTYQTIYEHDCVTIKTSAYNKMQVAKQDSGTVLYNKDGIRIVIKSTSNITVLNNYVDLFIENNTDKNIIVQTKDLSVNGFMTTSYFSSTVYAGKMAMDEIMLSSTSLEENNITNINKIEFVFHFVSNETFLTLFDSDVITINVD